MVLCQSASSTTTFASVYTNISVNLCARGRGLQQESGNEHSTRRLNDKNHVTQDWLLCFQLRGPADMAPAPFTT